MWRGEGRGGGGEVSDVEQLLLWAAWGWVLGNFVMMLFWRSQRGKITRGLVRDLCVLSAFWFILFSRAGF